MMPSKTFDIPACHVLEWPSDFTLLHYTSTLTLHITFAIQGQIFSIVGAGWWSGRWVWGVLISML